MNMQLFCPILLYLLLLNGIALILMGIDKKRARQNAWRIPEKMLFLPAVLGGSAGSILGMYLFRHKTRHWYFKYGMPLILIVQIAIALYLL